MCSKSPVTMIFSIEWMCFFVLGPLDHKYCLAQSIKKKGTSWNYDGDPWWTHLSGVWMSFPGRVAKCQYEGWGRGRRARNLFVYSRIVFAYIFHFWYTFNGARFCSWFLHVSAYSFSLNLFESLWYLCLFHSVSANFIIFYHNFLRISARFLCVCRDFGYETTVFICVYYSLFWNLWLCKGLGPLQLLIVLCRRLPGVPQQNENAEANPGVMLDSDSFQPVQFHTGSAYSVIFNVFSVFFSFNQF